MHSLREASWALLKTGSLVGVPSIGAVTIAVERVESHAFWAHRGAAWHASVVDLLPAGCLAWTAGQCLATVVHLVFTGHAIMMSLNVEVDIGVGVMIVGVGGVVMVVVTLHVKHVLLMDDLSDCGVWSLFVGPCLINRGCLVGPYVIKLTVLGRSVLA